MAATRTLTLALPKTGLRAGVVGDLCLADIGILRDTYRRAGVEVPAGLCVTPSQSNSGARVPDHEKVEEPDRGSLSSRTAARPEGAIVTLVPMREMSREEALEFLSEGTRTGKVATVRKDGRPHVVPIWFIVDDDDVVFTTWHRSVKAINLARDSWAALVVDLEEPPYAHVTVEGRVSISEDLDELEQYATRIGGRYMGEDRAEEFGTRNAVPGEVVVRLHIDKLVAKHDMTG